VSYHSLASDLEGVNFSSIRQGELSDRDVWITLQQWFIGSFVRPVFETWLQQQLALGTIRVPGKGGVMKALPADRYDKFRRAAFQGRRWAWVDPQKDMTANESAVALGIKSRSEIIRDMGRDPDDVWDEIKRENERLAALGITPAAPAQGQGGQANA